ncbi:MAG: hypothetical protein ABI693_14660 [Bryobacteraceae bacterium]
MKPDFSGTWILNTGASEFGFLKPPARREDVVVHQEPSLQVTTLQKDTNGDNMVTRAVTIGGGDVTIDVLGRPRQLSGFWDGDDLLLVTRWDVGGNPRELTDCWTLQDGGARLVIQRTQAMNGGPVRQRLVMQRT